MMPALIGEIKDNFGRYFRVFHADTEYNNRFAGN